MLLGHLYCGFELKRSTDIITQNKNKKTLVWQLLPKSVKKPGFE